MKQLRSKVRKPVKYNLLVKRKYQKEYTPYINTLYGDEPVRMHHSWAMQKKRQLERDGLDVRMRKIK